MLLSLANTEQGFDWIMGGIIAANVILFAILTFFPGVHNKITRSITEFFNKL